MTRILKLLLSPPVLGTLGLLAICAVIWWIGPLVAVGTWRPLDGVWARVIAIAALWLVWLAHLGLRAWRRRRAHAALVEGIAAPSATDREAQVLAQRFREAVSRLKAAQGPRPWFSRAASLYDMPWYVFVGAPGAGKTTALLNAGLQFVFAEEGAAVKGVGGTRNCDWWFTREAVLIDTAGRYALQESDKRVDAAAWDRFLMLLRKTRPRRPINGVLLTVNVHDLLQQSAAERTEHAAKLRARLHELQGKLGVQPPVYVLVTKADLIAGFAETFDPLGKEERDQVWGFSFDLHKTVADQPLREFDGEYRALVERLSAGLLDRMQAQRDSAQRAATFGFVQEFAGLQPLLGDFLAQVFASSGTLQESARLRGVYFTSGTQEGTPIDRVMGTLARSFGLERRAAASAGQRGKSYFLRRLMQDVVFPEAHLVSTNTRAERRRRAWRAAGFTVVALLTLGVAGAWGWSYLRNQAYDEQVAARVPALRQAVDALPPATSSDLAPLSPTLGALRAAAQPEGFALNDPPWSYTLGLYQGEKLDAGAQVGYRKLLEHAMLPRIARRLEERLRASGKDNLEQAYEALKGYLMLYTPDRFDADTLRAWIALDWDAQLRHLTPEHRAALDGHLDALLAQGAPRAVAPMDAALVGGMRDMLASYPLEYRVYSRITRRFRGDLPEFSVAGAAGPQAPLVFERKSGQPLSRGVPGFYTRDGYVKAFQGAVAGAAAQLAAEEPWVLGRGGNATKSVTAVIGKDLDDRVRRLYLQDYIKTWDAFLADVRLVPLTSLDRSIEVARVLGSIDSPLAAYLRGVARETTLVPPAAPQGGALAQAGEAARKAKEDLARLADPQAVPTTGPIERMVDDHFAPVRRMVQGQPAPIDEVQKSFGEVYTALQAVDAAQKSKSPPPAGGAEKIKAAAGQQPEPVRSMLESLAEAGMKQGRVAERDSLTGELKPVYDFCARAIANRYPFAAGSRADVLPEDFGQLFGGGGMLDEFYQRRLAALVDTGGATWTYKPLADGTRPPAPAALADFQRAARIREVFFRGGGRAPGFRVDVRAVELDPALKEVVLDIDGQAHKFVPGNTAPITVNWPSTRVAAQVRLSAASGGEALLFEGPWALFRLFDRFEVQPSGQPERFGVVMRIDGKQARLEVTANSVFNPFRLREIQQFRCPGAL